MSHFIGTIVVEPIDGTEFWITRQAFAYQDDDPNYSIEVPEGFITDFASIPRALWNIMAPTDHRWRGAALCHDRAYEQQVPKSCADLILERAAKVNGASDVEAGMLWAAVHLGGQSAWNTAPERQKERLAMYAKMHAADGTPIATG